LDVSVLLLPLLPLLEDGPVVADVAEPTCWTLSVGWEVEGIADVTCAGGGSVVGGEESKEVGMVYS
jgi:hypothetical protein